MTDRDKQCNENDKENNAHQEWADDETVRKRFFEKVEFNCNEQGCHKWTGAKQDASKTNTYGNVRINNKKRYTHRVRYIFANDHIPDHLEIDHLCNHKWCVRLDHLELVTKSENAKRAWDDGLCSYPNTNANKGGNNGQAKLTKEEVLEILLLYSRTDLSQSDLAEMYDVSQALVGAIYRGERWTHVDPPSVFPWPDFDRADEDWPEIFDSLIETERLARLIAASGGD